MPLDRADCGNNMFFNAKYCALHLNIHSLPSKHEQLKSLICELKNIGINVHFILLCETFLTDNNSDMYPILGYSFMHKSRRTMTKGGVAMYISNEFNFKERPDLCINIEGEFESIAAEIKSKNGTQNLIISEIYRIPNTNVRNSLARYEQAMTMLSNTNCDILVGSDQNMDYMQIGSNAHITELFDMYLTQGIVPTATRPTRITHTSATLIDNIYVKCPRYENINSRIIVSDISDHFPVLTCMGKKSIKKQRQPLIFKQRRTGNEQIQLIENQMMTMPWHDLFHDKKVTECYDTSNVSLTF